MHEIFTGNSDASKYLNTKIKTPFGELDGAIYKDSSNKKKFTDIFEKFEPDNLYLLFEK